MNSNFQPLRPPPRPHTPSGHRSQSSLSQTSVRSESSMSTASNDSGQTPSGSTTRRSPYLHQQAPARPSTAGGPGPSQSTNSIQTLPRHQVRTSVDGTIRTTSPGMPSQQFGHRARQHSQGFFEPSLPHATANTSGLTASQIAAQAAMHHVSPPASTANQDRKRSYPGLAPINTTGPLPRKSSDTSSPQVTSAGGLLYSNGTLGGHRLAAATAANAAFPNVRSPLPSPNSIAQQPGQPLGPPPEKEPKAKGSKMKLFSKPKNITLSKDKEAKVGPSVPSPGKNSISSNLLRNNYANASTTSLMDPMSSGSSLYSSANASTSTLVPLTSEKEKTPPFPVAAETQAERAVFATSIIGAFQLAGDQSE